MSGLSLDTHRRLFQEPAQRPAVWFMFDCHLFERVDMNDRKKAFEQIADLFAEDGCGSLYTSRPSLKLRGAAPSKERFPPLNGRKLPSGGWGVTAAEINDWLDAYYKA